MKNLLFKVFIIGLFIGVLASGLTMLFGIVAYYALKAALIILPGTFMEYAALFAVLVGLLCSFSWYGFILFSARKYFFEFLSEKKKK